VYDPLIQGHGHCLDLQVSLRQDGALQARSVSDGVTKVNGNALWLVALPGAFWWLLTAGGPFSWHLGIPAVLAAAWAGARLGASGDSTWSALGAAQFALVFLRESVRGGIDVAGRTLAPTPRVATGFRDYRIRLRDARARLLFVNTVSLLPGTLAADLEGDRLKVHALDINQDIAGELATLERAVGRVYREELQP
jgi:multicomponent Na+:H+ antiporter subunit E